MHHLERESSLTQAPARQTSPMRVQTELRIQRTGLVVLSVVLPALGIAYSAINSQDATWSRFVIGGIGLSLVAASYRWAWVRARFAPISLAFWMTLLGITLFFSSRAGFQYTNLVGLIVLQFGLLVVFPRPAYALFTQGVLLLGVVGAVLLIGDTGGNPVFLIGIPAALAAGGLMALRGRERLIQTIDRQRAELELRVAERTAQLEAEVLQRRLAESEALAASQAKSLFLTRMSHELRTPINAIVGYTELAQEEVLDEGLSAIGEDLEHVLTASGHLLRMVDDVLDVTRIEAGKLEMLPVETRLERAVERAVTAVGHRVEENGNHLVIEPIPEAEITVDPGRLAQILGNLLDNASRFTHAGTITLRTAVTQTHAIFEVHDTGVGIPAHALELIFDPFTQADESTVREVDGAGLGLFIARDLADRMGGEIAVLSELGAGSTFRLTLPRLQRS